MDALNKASKDITNKSLVEEKLVDMAGVMTQSIQKIENKDNISSITESFISGVKKVQDEGLNQSVEMNVSVGDFAQGVINKVGEVKPEVKTEKSGK